MERELPINVELERILCHLEWTWVANKLSISSYRNNMKDPSPLLEDSSSDYHGLLSKRTPLYTAVDSRGTTSQKTEEGVY